MSSNTYQIFNCDLCGSSDAVEVPHCREYTGGQVLHICTNCGLVYVQKRRSFEQIAADWSEKLFGEGYSAVIPAVKARMTYVAEFLNDSIGLQGKRACDIGAGEGFFPDKIRQDIYGAQVFGIEPSAANCRRLADLNIDHFNGTIEQFSEHVKETGLKDRMDVVTAMWTMECSQSPRNMLAAAHQILNDGGHILIATGSRILVPFKKPLHDFLSKNPADTHPLNFSANTLRGILAVSGFETTHINRYIDTDYLVVVARKVSSDKKVEWQKDNYLDVYNFFERWHVDTKCYYS